MHSRLVPAQRAGLVMSTLDRARVVTRLGALRPTTLAGTLQTLRAMFGP